MQLQSSILGRLGSELPGAICRDLGNPRAHLQLSGDRSACCCPSRDGRGSLLGLLVVGFDIKAHLVQGMR